MKAEQGVDTVELVMRSDGGEHHAFACQLLYETQLKSEE